MDSEIMRVYGTHDPDRVRALVVRRALRANAVALRELEAVHGPTPLWRKEYNSVASGDLSALPSLARDAAGVGTYYEGQRIRVMGTIPGARLTQVERDSGTELFVLSRAAYGAGRAANAAAGCLGGNDEVSLLWLRYNAIFAMADAHARFSGRVREELARAFADDIGR